MTRILVCGGRDYKDYDRLCETLHSLVHPGDCLITGGAKGADGLAYRWAADHGAPVMVFPAPWEHYGLSAGPIRNMWMVEHGKPDIVIAFPGGKGTTDMMTKARAAGIRVVEVS